MKVLRFDVDFIIFSCTYDEFSILVISGDIKIEVIVE